MNLEYIWIENFRVLKKIGFSFSSKRNYNYDHITKELKVTGIPNQIQSFFGINISDVKAIIGENGVGKSTLFEFIIRNLTSFGDGNSSNNNDGDFFIIISNIIIIKNFNLISNNDELRAQGFKFFNYNVNNLFFELRGTGYENIAYIYYSNVFDYKQDYQDSINLFDISTNHLLAEESVDKDGKSMLWYFVISEIKRQIDFIAETNYVVPFNLPKSLIINSSESVYIYKTKISFDELSNKGLSNIVSACSKQSSAHSLEKIKLLLFQNLLKYRSYLNPEIYKNINAETLISLYDNDFKDISIINNTLLKSEINSIKTVIDNFSILVRSESIKFTGRGTNFFTYNLRDDNSSLFSFMNSVNLLMGSDTFIYYSWDGISSGEKAFLSLLARLNFSKKKFKDAKEDDIKNIILFIDEFELYFHPEWQRTFLKILLSQLPKIFYQIPVQIVLSSHSPFLVSDLPKENIELLRKSDQGLCEKVELTKNTFGANIHSLYTDSFFLSNTIGEFANEKINNVIRDLIEPSIIPASKSQISLTIDLIGEPVIKNKLRKMFIEKFGKEEEILMLEKRLKELRGQ